MEGVEYEGATDYESEDEQVKQGAPPTSKKTSSSSNGTKPAPAAQNLAPPPSATTTCTPLPPKTTASTTSSLTKAAQPNTSSSQKTPGGVTPLPAVNTASKPKSTPAATNQVKMQILDQNIRACDKYEKEMVGKWFTGPWESIRKSLRTVLIRISQAQTVGKDVSSSKAEDWLDDVKKEAGQAYAGDSRREFLEGLLEGLLEFKDDCSGAVWADDVLEGVKENYEEAMAAKNGK